jgi:hypothetical protein
VTASARVMRPPTGKGGRTGMKNIVAKARARKIVAHNRENGPKASEHDHLNSQLFGGRHAKSNTATWFSNTHNSQYQGKHSDYRPKHEGSHNAAHDARQVSLSGALTYGRHAKAA